MKQYTIYCTEEQARRAYKLGAPLQKVNVETNNETPVVNFTLNGYMYSFEIPTTQQMIGWLKTKNIYVALNHISDGYSSWLKTIDTNEVINNLGYCSDEKIAILNGIDAALDYLEKKGE